MFLVLSPEESDQAAVTASSETTTMPATNLLRQQPTDFWRASQLSALRVTMHLPESSSGVARKAWDTITMLYTNFGEQDDLQIFAAANEADLDLAPTFQTDPILGVQSPDQEDESYPFVHALAWRESPGWLGQGQRTESWIRIRPRFLNPRLGSLPVGTPAFGQWGRLIAGKAWQPTFSVDEQERLTHAERPRRAATFSGGERVGRRRNPRLGEYLVHFLDRAEAQADLDELGRLRGSSGAVVTILEPEGGVDMHREFLYGTLDTSARLRKHVDVHEKRLTMREML
jgi:hypothetical protein